MGDHLIPWRLGYVTIGVPDLDEAVAFWTRFGGLAVSERSGDTVHLRGGTDHHWVVLSRTDTPGVRRLAFELGAYDDLERYAERLAEEKIEFTRHEGEWSGPSIRCHDPSGYEVELVTGLGHVPMPPSGGWFAPKELLHAVVAVADLDASFDFYHRVLGFRESDRVIGKTIFLRGGIGYHHALVIGAGRGAPPLLDHVCFLMPDLDDLMRARATHLEYGNDLDRDVLRHPTSGSMGFYAKAVPSPTTVEFCVDHMRITDPDYRPRALTPGRWTSNVWLPPKD